MEVLNSGGGPCHDGLIPVHAGLSQGFAGLGEQHVGFGQIVLSADQLGFGPLEIDERFVDGLNQCQHFLNVARPELGRATHGNQPALKRFVVVRLVGRGGLDAVQLRAFDGWGRRWSAGQVYVGRHRCRLGEALDEGGRFLIGSGLGLVDGLRLR